MGTILLDMILFCLIWSNVRGGVQGEHEMAESRGGPGADMGSVRRTAANGERQAVARVAGSGYGSG
jgi:hypothetical protein